MSGWYEGILVAVIGWDYTDAAGDDDLGVVADIMVANGHAATEPFFLQPDFFELVGPAGRRYELGTYYPSYPGPTCETTFVGPGEVVLCKAYFLLPERTTGLSVVHHIGGADEDVTIALGSQPHSVPLPLQDKADVRAPAIGEPTDHERGLVLTLQDVSSSPESDAFYLHSPDKNRAVEVTFTVENGGYTPLGFADMFNGFPVRLKDLSTGLQYVSRQQHSALQDPIAPGEMVMETGLFEVPKEADQLVLKLQFYAEEQKESTAFVLLP
jgi:hypothetical protein